MREYRYQLVFEGKAAPEDEMGQVMTVEARAGFEEGMDPVFSKGAPQAIFTSRVENLSETAFSETGEILFGGGTVLFETVGAGELVPSADPSRQIGLVTWKIVSGTGAFEGASGFIQSVFTVNEAAHVLDSQSGVLFLNE